MKNTKKYISTLLILCLAATFVLSGCGGQSKSETKNQDNERTDSAVTTEKTETQEQPVELIFYYPNTVSEDDQLVNDAVNEILKKTINATIKMNVVDWGSYTDKMNLVIASQEKFDICFTSSWANPPTQRILNGAYAQIDNLFQYAPKLKEVVPAHLWNVATYKGKIYAVPNYQNNAMSIAYYIQKKFVDKYNFDLNSVPREAGLETLEALEPLMEKIKSGEPGIYPLRKAGYSFGDDPDRPNADKPVGLDTDVINVDPDTGKAYNLIDTEWNRKVLEKTRDLYLKGYIRKDVASVTDDNADLSNNKYAMFLSLWAPGKEAEVSNQYNNEYVAVVCSKTKLPANAGSETMLAISRTSEHPDKAIQFIQELWTNPDVKNTIIFGIEDVHYKKIADNQIEFIEGSKYQQNCARWEMGTVFNSYLIKGEDPNVFQQLQEMEENAVPSKLAGFTFDPTNVKTEIAQLNAVFKEYVSLATGAIDPDSFLPKILEKMENAGIQKVLEEVDKQYADWLSTK